MNRTETVYELGWYAPGNGHEPSADWQRVRFFNGPAAVTRYINRASAGDKAAGEAGWMIRVRHYAIGMSPALYLHGRKRLWFTEMHWTDWMDKKARRDALNVA